MTLSTAPIRVDHVAAAAALPSLPVSRREEVFPEGEFPLRIMHVFDKLHLGGTEKIIMQLVKGFEGREFEHSICTLRGAESYTKDWAPGVQILDAGKDGAIFQFNVRRLAKLMKAARPTIVHSRNWGGIEAVLAARLAGVPVVIHSEHGYQLEMLAGLPFRQSLFRHMTYRWASAVFTVSRELRAFHAAQAWCNPDSIQVLYNGVDARKFRPRPEVRERVRRQTGIPVNATVIGFVGRMVALKDVMSLLRAAEAVAQTASNLYVLLVGSGPELGRLKDFVSQCPRLNGRVVFCGSSDDVPDLLNAMDVFVLPSLMEGMSNTLLEALASGLPVVASRVGGNPEVVEESVCGYLFPPGDVAQLASRMKFLIQNPALCAQLGDSARDRAVKQFSLDSMLGRYRDLYIGLAKRQGAIPGAGNYVRN